MGQGHFRGAIPLFERAIAIDPNFAMAYYLRGIAYEQAGDMERSAEDAKRAFSLVDRVSETERTDITAYYYRFTGELDKEIDAWQLSARNYPRNWGPHNQLSLTYIDMGQFEEGLKEGQESAQLEPHVEPPWRRQLDALMCLNRLPEAEVVAAKVRALGIDGSRIHQRFLELAYLQDDHPSIAREIQWFSGKPEEYLSFGLQAAYLNMHGQRRESSEEYQRAAETARRRDFDTSLTISRKPTPVPMRWPVIAKVRVGSGVRLWRWQCAMKPPRRKSSPRKLRSSFRTEQFGMPCSFPRLRR
jgi:tetratricopeptide (TPR) repeat protein